MIAFSKFISATNAATGTGAVLEIERDGKKLFIPLPDFDENDGFKVTLWTPHTGEVGIGYDLAGSASNKDICRIYRETRQKPRFQNSEKNL